MRTPPRIRGGVYLLGSRELGWYKIGMSEDVNGRVRGLMGSLPFNTDLIAVWPSQQGRRRVIEHYLHTTFIDKRVNNGEWFQFTPEELQRCVDMMAAKELPKDVPLRFTNGGAMHHIRTVIAPKFRAQKIFARFKATTELSKN